MGGNKLLAIGLAGLMVGLVALPASAQVRRTVSPAPIAGPTRFYAVPKAELLAPGVGVFSSGLFLAAPGMWAGNLGLMANGLSLRSQIGLPNFQLDSGLSAASIAPWSGQLSLAGKWGILQGTSGIISSVSALAGGVLALDVNGRPLLGLQLGLPISGVFAFNPVNTLGITLFPAYNLGAVQALPVGLQPVALNYLSLGVGTDFSLSRNLHVLADTNFGLPGVAGTLTQTNLGLRYAFAPNLAGDFFLGFAPGANLGISSAPATIGLAAHWGF